VMTAAAAATYGGGCESRNWRRQPWTTATTNRGRRRPQTAAGTNGLSHERRRARIGETAAVGTGQTAAAAAADRVVRDPSSWGTESGELRLSRLVTYPCCIPWYGPP
jgi:hypothetical protein